MLTVYGDLKSGNCYKIALLLRQLGQPYAWSHVDILAGETRSAEFLAKNPNGKIPLLETEDGFRLAESNAILCHLAEGSALMPDDSRARATVLQWMFFEQYSHEPMIAVARFIIQYLNRPRERAEQLEKCLVGGAKALAVMEQQLARTPFIAGECYTVADIALYAYTHVADEGGFDLAPFPHLCGWLQRVAAQNRHLSLPAMLHEFHAASN